MHPLHLLVFLFFCVALLLGLFWWIERYGKMIQENDRLNKEREVSDAQKQALANRPSAVERLRDGKF